MGKYTIHSTKQDWENLYKEYEQLEKHIGKKIDMKRIKKSTSFDTQWTMLQLMKRKYNLK